MLRHLADLSWLLLLGLALVASACSKSGGLQPVQGKVLYKGAPLSGAKVVFHPKVSSDSAVDWPVGETGADGTFAVSTGGNAGAAPGQYSVTIVCLEMPAEQAGKPKTISTAGVEPQDRLKGVYANSSKSTISVVVSSGMNQLDPFVLK